MTVKNHKIIEKSENKELKDNKIIINKKEYIKEGKRCIK